MQHASEESIRKKAVEHLRQAVRGLNEVGDHGTVAKLGPILERLSERRRVAVANRTRSSN